MWVDEAKIFVKAGDGGNGVISFLRLKYVPRGGPDGGNGGSGGSVYLQANTDLSTLIDFRYRVHFKAERGRHGQGDNKAGRTGEDLVILVPLGTVARNAETNQIVADLVENGQKALLAKGGRGGRGNASFATAYRKAPKFAEKGETGEEGWFKLELKVLADVGLVGFPNVGKSTFISVVTSAKPKIADYPFTTLTPNLGIVSLGLEEGSFVIADLPGLIEGASEGKGLGHRFLKHVERTRVLVHMLDITEIDKQNPLKNYYIIRRELTSYSEKLVNLPEIIVINKADLPVTLENLPLVKDEFARLDREVFVISAVTRQGIKELLYKLKETLNSLPVSPQIKEDVPIIRLKPQDEGVTILKEEDFYQVKGKDIERLVSMTDLNNDEAVNRLQFILEKKGIFKALAKEGVQEGDLVKIKDFEFTWEA